MGNYISRDASGRGKPVQVMQSLEGKGRMVEGERERKVSRQLLPRPLGRRARKVVRDTEG